MSKQALCIKKQAFIDLLRTHTNGSNEEKNSKEYLGLSILQRHLDDWAINQEPEEDNIDNTSSPTNYSWTATMTQENPDYTGYLVGINTHGLLPYMNMECELVDRDVCENSLSYLQIIPYISFSCTFPEMSFKDPESPDTYILKYTRGNKGGEDRLFSKHSVGFGGHIEDLPEGPGYFFLFKTIVDSALREINEELGLEITPGLTNMVKDALRNFSSFIIEDSPVGQVHLGIHIDINIHDLSLYLDEDKDGYVAKSFLEKIPGYPFGHSDEQFEVEKDIVKDITMVPLNDEIVFDYNWEGWSVLVLSSILNYN